MHLNTKPIVFFILLAVSTLVINNVYSSPFLPYQEAQQTEDTQPNGKGDPEKAEEIKPEVAATDTEATQDEATEDDHQHDVIINLPVNAFDQQQQDIKHYLTQEKIIPIMVGTDKYLTIINQHTTPVNKGVMVLIPDWQQSITTPYALNQLRKNMPVQGWTTITLHPPNKPEGYPSQALTAEERNKENIEILENYGKKFAEVMQATIEQAKRFPGGIIVIAEGNNSAVLLDIYQQGLVGAPAAFIMLSSYMPTQPASEKIAQQLAVTDYPILDLYLQRDHHLVQANAILRKASAKRELKIYFRQKQLSNQVTGYYPKNSLTKEIISWLNSMGW